MALSLWALSACDPGWSIDADVVVTRDVQASLTDYPYELRLRTVPDGRERDASVELLAVLCEPGGDVTARWHRDEIGCAKPWRLQAWLAHVDRDLLGDFPCGPLAPEAQFYLDDSAPAASDPQASATAFEGRTGCSGGEDFLRLEIGIP